MFHPIPVDRTVVDHQGRPSGPSGDAPGEYPSEPRCTCCDGPDGLGYRHVRGLEGLRAILRTTCPGPFIVDDHRGRYMLGPLGWPEAQDVLHDWDHEQALVAREERRR